MSNLFGEVPEQLPEELIEVLAENQHVRLERIVSHGQASPEGFWYDQDEHEWVVVLQGEAKLLFADGDAPLHLRPGDYVNIAAHRKHRVLWTTLAEPTIWLAVFYRGN